MKKGWIKLYREIKDSVIWQHKPFSWGQAWIDLLLRASHEQYSEIRNNELVNLNRGELVTSVRELAEAWGWGRTQTQNFLKICEREQMISQKASHRKTVITIDKYCIFQDTQVNDVPVSSQCRASVEPVPSHKQELKEYKELNNIYINTREKTTGATSSAAHINQNIKKINFADNVLMSNAEHETLVKKYGEEKTRLYIDKLSNYKASTGKKYKSDYRAILSWVIGAVDKDIQCKPQDYNVFDDNYSHEDLEKLTRR